MSTQTSQKIAQIKSQIKDIEAVKKSLQTKFNIADDVPFNQYPDLISPVAQGETVFYKAASSYHDPYVPAHSNLQISGMENPSDGNGTFVNVRPDYLGFMRMWKNGNYACSFDSTNGFWCIHNASTTANYYDCYFRAKCFATSEAGTYANPWIFDKLATANDYITDAMDISKFPQWEGGYIYVTLKAGTAYKFGIKQNLTLPEGVTDGYKYCYQYLYTGDNQSHLGSGNESSAEDINGVACTNVFSYTPTTSGVYCLRPSYEGYNYTGDIQIVCFPAPQAWDEPSADPWDYSFVTQNGAGALTMSEISVAEHLATKTWQGYRAYKKYTADNKAYYEFASVLTTGLTWNKFAPNVGEIFSEDAAVKVTALDYGETYPDNATVWKINITSDNTVYYMCVSGGAGNIINWGDGSQTSTLSANSDTNSRYTHTYAKAGIYIIQVIGDRVEHIATSVDSKYNTNATDTYIIEAIQCSKSILNGNHMFYSSVNLERIADTFQLPRGLVSGEGMFNGCSGLRYAPETLRIPASLMNLRHFMQGCSKLKVDISHWFDDIIIGQNANKRFYNTFYRCPLLMGTATAEKLWLDGTWACCSTENYSFGLIFYQCTGLSNYNDIPTKWKA